MTLLINSLLLLLCIFATEVLSLSRTQKQLEFSIEDVTKVDTYIYKKKKCDDFECLLYSGPSD